jgi:membrane-associated phospholipid phosphatase
MKGTVLALFFAGLLNLFPAAAQTPDIDLLFRLNSGRPLFMDHTCIVLSKSVTPVVIAEPVGIFIYSMAKKDSVLKKKAFTIAASLVLAELVSGSLKILVHRDRPFVTYPVITQKTDVGTHSFPSGHTASAFSSATAMSLAFPKWYVIAPSFVWAAGVAYSRMELGVHYPTDVLAGAVTGAGASWLMWEANKWLQRKR